MKHHAGALQRQQADANFGNFEMIGGILGSSSSMDFTWEDNQWQPIPLPNGDAHMVMLCHCVSICYIALLVCQKSPPPLGWLRYTEDGQVVLHYKMAR